MVPLMMNLIQKSSDDDYNRKSDVSTGESQDETITQEGSSYMITDKIMDESVVDIPESGKHTQRKTREIHNCFAAIF